MSNTSSPPPLVGFNNNVRYRGMRFHIQTEDSGVARPHIITHLFADGGHIIKSLRTDYAEYVGHPERPQLIAKMMREQHRAMALELRGGALDGTIEQLRRAAAETERVPESAALAQLPPAADAKAPAPEPEEAAPITARSAELATRRASGDDIATAVVTAAVESSRSPGSSRNPGSNRRNAIIVDGAASSRRSKAEAPPVSSRKGSTLRPAVSQRDAAAPVQGAGAPPEAPTSSSKPVSSGEAAPTSSRSTASSGEAAPTSSRSGAAAAPPPSNRAPAPNGKPGPRRTLSSPRKAGRPALLPEKPTGESLFGALPKESLDDAILSYVSHAKPPPSSRGSK